ncbi:hypothetical protein LJR066_002912 [Acidovorax sp. LjRoot66]|uniref:hypothetical protein n=1 Tax=Acidovorax sp. LjRoot66 TaxID=3342334 RepID=UPI003ECD4F43
MAYEHQSTSADGRFALQVDPWEARNSHWVLTPQVRDLNSGRVLFKPVASSWSADGSTWTGSQVRIALRKYPGDQPRPCLAAWVDCEREVAWIEGSETRLALDQLEAELERSLLAGKPER